MSRGGWRYGAGRRGWRRKCEDLPSLDIRHLKRSGCLEAGQAYSLGWGQEANKNSARAIIGDQEVVLAYAWESALGKSKQTYCHLAISTTACNLGGTRSWFICPDCDRRCAIVYGISRRGNFACRVCQGLAYSSEAESLLNRLARKIGKLERRLIDPLARITRPRRKTIERICIGIETAEKEWDGLYASLQTGLCGMN